MKGSCKNNVVFAKYAKYAKICKIYKNNVDSVAFTLISSV